MQQSTSFKCGNRDAKKGQTSISIGDEKVGMTPLCFKCGEHDHYVVVSISWVYTYCIEEPESELESYPKE